MKFNTKLQGYSTYQLITTLDFMLYQAVDSMIASSRFVDSYLSYTLCLYKNSRNRKLGSHNKDKMSSLVALYLMCGDIRMKQKLIRKMKIDRSVLFYLLNEFVSRTANYRKWYCDNLHRYKPSNAKSLNSIDEQVSATDTLYFDSENCKLWYEKSIEFKNLIIERYLALAMKEAAKYKRNHSRPDSVDFDDTMQNFALAISKAVDKCDANKGTLTSYVQQWIAQAQTSKYATSVYGEAYSIPHSRRIEIAKKNIGDINISVSYEADDSVVNLIEEDIEQKHTDSHDVILLRKLAKEVDPRGVARIDMEIREILNKDELQLLRTQSYEDMLNLKEKPGAINDR